MVRLRNLIAVNALGLVSSVAAYISFPSEFIPVNYTVAGKWNESTIYAQKTIIAAAEEWAAEGPWSVTNKTILPPTGDKHDYLSWRPYFWPDCTGVGNTTALTPEQIWTTCPYVRRDGEFNPDVRMVNDTGHFQAMSDGVFYNILAWRFTQESKYVANVVQYIHTWFLNPDTRMNPHLDYAQTLRGPNKGEAVGSHTGVLDLKGMAKISGAVLIMRELKPPQWTNEIDTQFVQWCTTYINWLKTSKLALEEKAALNNHGSFYFTQLAAIQLIVKDTAGTKATIDEYFNGIYQNQIEANGEQPLEADRTRPYHYRAYNAAAIVTTSRIAEVIGYNTWNIKTKSGATVKTAIDYAMQFDPKSKADSKPNELWSPLAAVASVYGDPDGKYAAYLTKKEPQYPAEAWFWWNQPLSDSGIKVRSAAQVDSNPSPSSGSSKPKQTGAAVGLSATSSLTMVVAALAAGFSALL